MRVSAKILLISAVLSVLTMPTAAALAGHESRYDAYDSYYYDEPYPYDEYNPPPYEYDDYYRPRGGVTFGLALPVPAFHFDFGHWGHGGYWGGGHGYAGHAFGRGGGYGYGHGGGHGYRGHGSGHGGGH
jgi:hypothetical protein